MCGANWILETITYTPQKHKPGGSVSASPRDMVKILPVFLTDSRDGTPYSLTHPRTYPVNVPKRERRIPWTYRGDIIVRSNSKEL